MVNWKAWVVLNLALFLCAAGLASLLEITDNFNNVTFWVLIGAFVVAATYAALYDMFVADL